jgi:hypothetical protein
MSVRFPLSHHTLLDQSSSSFPGTSVPTFLQAQVDHLVGGFIEQATDWRSLAAMTAGGMAHRLGRIGVMSHGGVWAAIPLRTASVAIGLGAEVVSFEMTNRFLQNPPTPPFAKGGQGGIWRWDGPGGIRQGLLNSLFTFGTLKGAGRLAQGENVVVQHILQDTGMVLGHQVSALLGITDRPQGTLAEQFLHAEVTNLQLGAGVALAHTIAPGIQGLERGLDLSLCGTDGRVQPAAPLQIGSQPAFAVIGTGKKDSGKFEIPKVFLNSSDDNNSRFQVGPQGGGKEKGPEGSEKIFSRIEQRYKIPFLDYLRRNVDSSDFLLKQDKDPLIGRLISGSKAEIADELFFALMRHWVEQDVQPYQRGKVRFRQTGPILEVMLDHPLSEIHLNYILHIQEHVKPWGLTLYETGEGGTKIRMPALSFMEALMKKRFGDQALRFIPFEGEMPRDEAALLLKWGYRPIGLPLQKILLNGIETHPFQFALHDLYHLVKWAADIPLWMQKAAALYYESHRELMGASGDPNIRFYSDWEMGRIADLALYSEYRLSHLISDYGKTLREDVSLPPGEADQALRRIFERYLEKLEGFFPGPSSEVEAHRREIQGLLEAFFGQTTNF